jgi:hypothetical protein
MFWVWLSTTPRYRARLEQWIVASLCKRNADCVFRLVEAYPGVVGSSRRSEGRGWVGITEDLPCACGPPRGNENQRRHPRESGGPLLVRNTMDSRFPGNDVFFEGDAGDQNLRDCAEGRGPQQHRTEFHPGDIPEGEHKSHRGAFNGCPSSRV